MRIRRRLHQERQAGEAEADTGEDFPGRPRAPWAQPAEEDHPQRHRGDQESRRARRQPLLGPDQRTVASEEQEPTDQRRGAPVDTARPRCAAPARPDVENGAGDQVAHSGHEKRRDRLDRHRDRQIGRAPDDIDRPESQHHLEQSWRLGAVVNQGTPPPARGFQRRAAHPRWAAACFAQRFEDDRRARRADGADRPEALAQQPAQALRIRKANLRQIAVLAGDVMNLLDLGDLGQQLTGAAIANALFRADEDIGEKVEPESFRIDPRLVALDHPLKLQLTDALQNR